MTKIVTINLIPFSKFWQIPFYNQFGYISQQAEPVSKCIILISKNIFGTTCFSVKHVCLSNKKHQEHTSRWVKSELPTHCCANTHKKP